jgi:hypothetical protein
MKRVLVVLLALVMGAGLAFAADQAPAKWTAYVEGWLNFWDQDGNTSLGPSWAGDTATGQFTDLTLTYAEANVGFSFVDEFDSNVWSANLRNMSGWFSLFNGMVKLTAGLDRVADYRPGTYIEGATAYSRIANAEWGLLTQVYPMKPLSLGVFVKFPQVATVQDYEHNLGFGASYALDGIGTFYWQYRSINNQMGVAAKISAIKVLPLFFAYGIGFAYPDSTHTILFSTQYVMDALTVCLDAKVVLLGTAFDYNAVVKATYKLNDTWSVGANIGYGDIAYSTGGSLGGLFLYPWANIAVGSGSSLKLGFILDTDGDDTGADVLKWSIPLRYVISF